MNPDAKQMLAKYQPKAGKALQPDQQLGTVRFSPCGKFLVAGGFDGTVRRWDALPNPMTSLPPLPGLGGWVQAIAFHPDGKRLFAADSWGNLRCWPFAEKEPRILWSVNPAHDGWVRGIAVSPDGKTIATCGRDRAVRVWSAGDGQKLQELQQGEDAFAVSFHPDGKSLVASDLKGAVKQWDLPSGKPVREFDARVMYYFERLQDVGGVRCLAFDRQGTTLACGGGQPKSGGFVQAVPVLLVIDWQSGRLKQSIKIGGENDGYVLDLHFHPGGFVMGVTSGQPGSGKLFFHRPGDAQPFFVTTAMPNCHSLAVHPNEQRLVVAATNANSSGNGRFLNDKKEYPGNTSPLFVWDIPPTT